MMDIILKRLPNKYLIRNVIFIHRTIMSSSSRYEKAVENLKTNPYFEKYAEKIATLQETSPEEFVSRIQTNEESKKAPKFGGIKERQYSSLLKPKELITKSANAGPDLTSDKNLNDIMKIDLIRDKKADELKHIWQEYHKTKDVIAAAVPSEIYNCIITKSKRYPIFLFPLPRSQGYEFIMCQFSSNTVHFTPLICYQVHKENSPECLTITHYTEFKDDKNIVLMRGEFDKNVIDAKEAQCLANQLQIYYGQDNNEKKLKLLEQFTNKSDDFKHVDLITELENLSL